VLPVLVLLHTQVDMAVVVAAVDIDCIAVGAVPEEAVGVVPRLAEVAVVLLVQVVPQVRVEFVVLALLELVLQQVFRIEYKNSHFLRYCHILSNS